MSTKEILLVDDDIDDLEIFIEAIESLDKNVKCRTSLSPKLALEELIQADNLPDLILLDYNMPQINGLEFLKRLQSDTRLAAIEVIIVSTPEEEVMVPWLNKNGVNVKYISKPSDFAELKTVLNDIL
ncbi:response regulator [Flavobacterium olei]|uniref:response regulator n=1 Tax=Flavobacterium olei TaxID=1886782 RepID=UPI00321BC55D